MLSASPSSTRYFNPRSHEGSDTNQDLEFLQDKANFNPRSHEGSDFGIIWCCRTILFQSTLPRGERRYWLSEGKYNCISIHAPTRGATKSDSAPVLPLFISIHAPTRGATFRGKKFSTVFVNFNPRSHEGSDDLYDAYMDQAEEFQSTLPRGERLQLLGVPSQTYGISIHAPTRGATAIFAKKFSFLSAKIV